MYKNLITQDMIDEFNLIMEKEKSCLRIIFDYEELGIMKYKISVEDKYINDFIYPNLTKEFEDIVRNYFKEFGIKLPFENTVIDIWAYETIE